jgi:CRISPR type III-associated protein (TIGR04423 family)
MQTVNCEKIQISNLRSNETYTGYYWLSDADHPVILENQPITYTPVLNPFIIEGHLFSEKDNASISVRHIDGQYLIYKMFWETAMPEDIISEGTYTYLAGSSFKKSGIKTLRFRRYWQEHRRENCAGMAVLEPGPVGFIGFGKETGND